MNNHIFPVIGNLPVSELKPRHFIDLLKRIEEKVCWKLRPARGST
ncbi:integrase [Klebsiella pneumoniae]|uniref:Integrase n=1 Tax=Klebsiella pneumoniae TaxID=573 RepID=A0A377WKB8_KLEPN|nr:integrase [Klebsiella pneumoniae]